MNPIEQPRHPCKTLQQIEAIEHAKARLAVELPRWEKERREERAEMLTSFKSERADIINSFRQQMDEKRKGQLTEERQAFEQMLQRLSKEPK